MIELKQFAGSVIQPEDDARLYDFIISQNTGIIEGCQITHLGANKLQISAGWGICCGRVFVVTAETIDAQLSTGDNMQGRILIEINTGISSPAKFVTQAAASLPEITKEDLNKGGTVHQIPLATYKVNALTVSELKDVRKIITSPQSAAEKAQRTAETAKANAFSLYTHTAGRLTGSGANGKFKATVSETVTKLNVSGVSCTIKSGSETQMELIAGCWYTFILDGNTINFTQSSQRKEKAFDIVTLWQNNNKSAFAAQTITLNWQNCKKFYVEFWAHETSYKIETTPLHNIGDIFDLTFNATGSALHSNREFDSKTLQFKNAINSRNETVNIACIPKVIYGLKY